MFIPTCNNISSNLTYPRSQLDFACHAMRVALICFIKTIINQKTVLCRMDFLLYDMGLRACASVASQMSSSYYRTS